MVVDPTGTMNLKAPMVSLPQPGFMQQNSSVGVEAMQPTIDSHWDPNGWQVSYQQSGTRRGRAEKPLMKRRSSMSPSYNRRGSGEYHPKGQQAEQYDYVHENLNFERAQDLPGQRFGKGYTPQGQEPQTYEFVPENLVRSSTQNVEYQAPRPSFRKQQTSPYVIPQNEDPFGPPYRPTVAPDPHISNLKYMQTSEYDNREAARLNEESRRAYDAQQEERRRYSMIPPYRMNQVPMDPYPRQAYTQSMMHMGPQPMTPMGPQPMPPQNMMPMSAQIVTPVPPPNMMPVPPQNMVPMHPQDNMYPMMGPQPDAQFHQQQQQMQQQAFYQQQMSYGYSFPPDAEDMLSEQPRERQPGKLRKGLSTLFSRFKKQSSGPKIEEVLDESYRPGTRRASTATVDKAVGFEALTDIDMNDNINEVSKIDDKNESNAEQVTASAAAALVAAAQSINEAVDRLCRSTTSVLNDNQPNSGVQQESVAPNSNNETSVIIEEIKSPQKSITDKRSNSNNSIIIEEVKESAPSSPDIFKKHFVPAKICKLLDEDQDRDDEKDDVTVREMSSQKDEPINNSNQSNVNNEMDMDSITELSSVPIASPIPKMPSEPTEVIEDQEMLIVPTDVGLLGGQRVLVTPRKVLARDVVAAEVGGQSCEVRIMGTRLEVITPSAANAQYNFILNSHLKHFMSDFVL